MILDNIQKLVELYRTVQNEFAEDIRRNQGQLIALERDIRLEFYKQKLPDRPLTPEEAADLAQQADTLMIGIISELPPAVD